MADNETTADVIAWLRKPIEGENAYLTLWRNEIANRLEAALKRELSKDVSKNGADFGQLGDAAKLREALNRLGIASEGFLKTHSAKYYVDTTEALDKAKAALAAPARNCDKYSHDQALRKWSADPENPMNGCFDEWLYNPATEKEGDNHGNE